MGLDVVAKTKTPVGICLTQVTQRHILIFHAFKYTIVETSFKRAVSNLTHGDFLGHKLGP
jgi:hypothetical protein